MNSDYINDSKCVEDSELLLQITCDEKLKKYDIDYSDLSQREIYIVKHFQSLLDLLYNEVIKAMEIFNLEKNIYSFHEVIKIIVNKLYEYELFVFNDISLLVNSDDCVEFENSISYLVECVHAKHLCATFFFLTPEKQKLIIENSKYLKDNRCVDFVCSLSKEYADNVLKHYIYEILKNQFIVMMLYCKNNIYFSEINSLTFMNKLQIVGAATDIKELQRHFIKELENIINKKFISNEFINLKNFLINLLEYKIALLSNNEICLMLKIYCILNDTNMSMLKHLNSEEVFYSLINIFNQYKNQLYQNSGIKFRHFSAICDKYFKNYKSILFLNSSLIDKIKLLNDKELNYLKDILDYEINSNNSNKYFYDSISPLGSFISDSINREIYCYICD